ncbi:MAG: 30S ribosomal protein S5 [Candidatus Lindowbacteria bacterium RIFCSPLOWO2_12_FULL_62_27]|nr:MAG: 30S ribosomal protein S5 [Candidatus Lindowbacteria bacterium RIFCSPLOWO2_12_FULL_62_27]OGH63574.1 MAG: 30S ribosomal protein S5 [Candidatus Lindowbacteria bacterium RIFCSPLOWO2_02_FULL_62_12]
MNTPQTPAPQAPRPPRTDGRGDGRQRSDSRRRFQRPQPGHAPGEPALIERVVQINHVAKVVKGGRRFGFSTIVVVGDGNGKVGVSIGKAKEVPESITKGRSHATKTMTKIKIVEGTIPHEIVGRCGATRVLLRPAVPGTGIIAGKSVRAILEAAGIRDVLSKTIGSSNAVNAVKAVMDGLLRLRLPEDVAEMRGKTVGEMFIAKRVRRLTKFEDEMGERMEGGEAEQLSPEAAQARRREQRPSGSMPPRHRTESQQGRTHDRGGPDRSRGRRPDRDRDRRPRPDRRPPRPAGPPSSSAEPGPLPPQTPSEPSA